MGATTEATWPVRYDRQQLKKPDREKRKKRERKVKAGRRTDERKNKALAKARDGRRCRWPLCGCRKKRLRIDSSHDRHKGIGGDKTGERSKPAELITFCVQRHQTGAISRHAGTLRTRYLTNKRNDGPVAFEVRLEELADLFRPGAPIVDMLHDHGSADGWVELAREDKPGQLLPVLVWQKVALEKLAEMEK